MRCETQIIQVDVAEQLDGLCAITFAMPTAFGQSITIRGRPYRNVVSSSHQRGRRETLVRCPKSKDPAPIKVAGPLLRRHVAPAQVLRAAPITPMSVGWFQPKTGLSDTPVT
jgi:hypothetical protein